MSFKVLEDDILRARFKDPCIHFTLNCAPKSCPPIMNAALVANSLERQLDLNTKAFINNQDNFIVDHEEKKFS